LALGRGRATHRAGFKGLEVEDARPGEAIRRTIRSDGRLGAMSSFFEPPPPPPEPPPEPPRRPWAGARDAVIGRTVALNLVIARSDKAALWIPAVTAFLDGFEFDVELRGRLDDEEFGHPFFFAHHPRRRRRRTPEEGLDPELLRLGIQFSDGRKATNIESRMPFPMAGEPDEPPEGPVLFPRGGGGGDGRWSQGFWVWPLPPEGPLAFVCEWPAADIPETRSEIDSVLVRDAAAEAVILWSDVETRSGAGGIVWSS
jgi:hypothetical protein